MQDNIDRETWNALYDKAIELINNNRNDDTGEYHINGFHIEDIIKMAYDMGYEYANKERSQKLGKESLVKSAIGMCQFDFESVSPSQWWDQIRDDLKTKENIDAILKALKEFDEIGEYKKFFQWLSYKS